MKKILKIIITTIGLFFGFINITNASPAGYISPIEKLQLQVPILNYAESTGIAEYIGYAYQAALYIIVPLAIIVVIYAGFMWIMAGGDRSKIQNAKKYISGSFWGLTLALLSYILLSLVGIGQINQPTPDYIGRIGGEIIIINGEPMSVTAAMVLLPPENRGPAPTAVNTQVSEQLVSTENQTYLDYFINLIKTKSSELEMISTACAAEGACPPDAEPIMRNGNPINPVCGTGDSTGKCCTDTSDKIPEWKELNHCQTGRCGGPYEKENNVLCCDSPAKEPQSCPADPPVQKSKNGICGVSKGTTDYCCTDIKEPPEGKDYMWDYKKGYCAGPGYDDKYCAKKVLKPDGTENEYRYNCPSSYLRSTALNKEIVEFKVFFTNYYKPPYPKNYTLVKDEKGELIDVTYDKAEQSKLCLGLYNDFFKNVGMNCTCPNGRTSTHTCKPFEPDTTYCHSTFSETTPSISTSRHTVAADLNCFKKGCTFHIKEIDEKNPQNKITWKIEDIGGKIEKNHMDLWAGNENDITSGKSWHPFAAHPVSVAGGYMTIQIKKDCLK